jgi:hypothetical protein
MDAFTMEVEWLDDGLVQSGPTTFTQKTWKGLVALTPIDGRFEQGVELEAVPFTASPEQYWTLSASGLLRPANCDEDLVVQCAENGLVTLQPLEGGAAQKWTWQDNAFLVSALAGSCLTIESHANPETMDPPPEAHGKFPKREGVLARYKRDKPNHRDYFVQVLRACRVPEDQLAAEADAKVARLIAVQGLYYRQRWVRRSDEIGAAT